MFGEAQIANLTEKYIRTLRMTNVTVSWTNLAFTVGGTVKDLLTPTVVADWLRNKLNNDLFPFFDVWIEHYS